MQPTLLKIAAASPFACMNLYKSSCSQTLGHLNRSRWPPQTFRGHLPTHMHNALDLLQLAASVLLSAGVFPHMPSSDLACCNLSAFSLTKGKAPIFPVKTTLISQ